MVKRFKNFILFIKSQKYFKFIFAFYVLFPLSIAILLIIGCLGKPLFTGNLEKTALLNSIWAFSLCVLLVLSIFFASAVLVFLEFENEFKNRLLSGENMKSIRKDMDLDFEIASIWQKELENENNT